MVEYVRDALRSLPGPPGTASYKPCSFSYTLRIRLELGVLQERCQGPQLLAVTC